jgi:hypothetical protein
MQAANLPLAAFRDIACGTTVGSRIRESAKARRGSAKRMIARAD